MKNTGQGEVVGGPALRRTVGLPGAVMLGLGAMVGTGVFVSIGLAIDLAGPWTLAAVGLAGAVAACNALSSAQLAASHPVSGGTYEYGYRYLHPSLGFLAGAMFLFAKSASAATAALGVAGYGSEAMALMGEAEDATSRTASGVGLVGVAVAVGVVAGVMGLILSGLRRSSGVNIAVVTLTLTSLSLFVVGLTWSVMSDTTSASTGDLKRVAGGWGEWSDFMYASALMFVAYTGYGRVATLGEEVVEPRRTIPRAIIATVAVVVVLYLAVAGALLLAQGSLMPDASPRSAVPMGGGSAPLAEAASQRGLHWLAWVVTVGAVTAMWGVLLNLLLGLSRVVLAMGRRGDLPRRLAGLKEGGEPVAAIVAVALLVAGLTLLGDVKTTWSLSAFTVLIYYSLTNAAALRLPQADRLYPRWVSWAGLAGCIALAAFVHWPYLLAGLAVAVVAVAGHAAWRWMKG